MRPKFCKYHSAIGKERKKERKRKGKEERKKKEINQTVMCCTVFN
jgi:hypothetical protein